jgi:RNA-directed DNA polymerase
MWGLMACERGGTPRGSPLSPLLSNVMLDDLDGELERRGRHFVRYAGTGVSTSRASVRVSASWRGARGTSASA